MIRRTTVPSLPTPEILGVDDWALRRGQHYGTILCDLERHRPVELLPERSSDVLRDWLVAHPGVKVISRDRGDNYIKGATLGAPQAVQVADRWHLLHNLREALTRLADRYPRQIEAAAITAAQGQEALPESAKPAAPIPGPPQKKPTCAEELQQLHRQRRIERYQRVLELYTQHLPVREIARRMGMNRNTVRKFVRADSFPERAHRYYPCGTDPFLDYLQQRWQEGCHNATELTRELRDRGFRGSYNMVRRRVASWRERPRSRTRSSRTITPHNKIDRPSSSRVSWLLLKPPVDLDSDERALVEALAEHCPALLAAQDLAQQFVTIVRDRKAELLEDWRLRACSPESPAELQSFARGLGDDRAAIEAALTLRWSNGQTEGQINRLKLVKRQMFGRGKMDLLRQRFLYPV
jgi:transposase